MYITPYGDSLVAVGLEYYSISLFVAGVGVMTLCLFVQSMSALRNGYSKHWGKRRNISAFLFGFIDFVCSEAIIGLAFVAGITDNYNLGYAVFRRHYYFGACGCYGSGVVLGFCAAYRGSKLDPMRLYVMNNFPRIGVKRGTADVFRHRHKWSFKVVIRSISYVR